MIRSACLLPGILLVLLASSAQAQRPSFVFFLVDDLGYMDIGANNPDTFYETPNIDRLAARGMRFTQGYAANPVCSPTRYSIMTGKYPSRIGATNFFSGDREGRFKPAPLNDRMPLEEVTLAEALQEHGYRTAFVGKWHLGPTAEFWPEQQGFEINIAGHHRGSPPGGYFAPWNNPRLKDGPNGEFLTQRLADESLAILDQLQNEPFLLYLAFHQVHTPLQAPQKLIAKYKAKAERLGLNAKPEFATEDQVWPVDEPRRVRILQKHATYAAMVESMDTAVGRVLDKLEQLGLSDSTTVCFFSDNGGLSTSEGSPTSNLPLRGGKGWTYEGGIREPMIIASPGLTAPGSVCNEPVISMDFYPTLLDIAGVPLRPDQHLDGVSLTPLLEGADALTPRPLHWHYPHYSNQGGFPSGAIRLGDWKFVEHYEDGSGQLFNLADDLSEQHNRIDEQPERASALRKQLHEWYKAVDARFLQPRDGRQPWSPLD
jgi:arylsulfatase A-like enzyme